ncbi:hypothetical protein GAY28_20430, partial [Azospirillum brasilense]|nr:hypothetical protein [Azospirillum brasilense]
MAVGLMERAGHLPGLSADAVEWRTLTFRRGAETLDVGGPGRGRGRAGAQAGRGGGERRDQFIEPRPITHPRPPAR